MFGPAKRHLMRRWHHIRKPAGTERFPCCSDKEWSVQTTTSTVARQARAIMVRKERPVAGRRCRPGAVRGRAGSPAARPGRRRISVFPRGPSQPPRRALSTSATFGSRSTASAHARFGRALGAVQHLGCIDGRAGLGKPLDEIAEQGSFVLAEGHLTKHPSQLPHRFGRVWRVGIG